MSAKCQKPTSSAIRIAFAAIARAPALSLI